MSELSVDQRKIVFFPDPVLRAVAKPVEAFGPDLHRLADRMFELMRAEKGVGLAAPQVGVSIRLFVCNPTGKPEDDLVCVNPQLFELTGAAEHEEGCLSIPDVKVTMRRSKHALLRAHDADGQPFERAGTDLPARIWQHEIDHLNGRLILDFMSATDDIANRKAIQKLRADYSPPKTTKPPTPRRR
ncbi:MAG: peptide deformylase [Planctomycetota bacterium]